MNYAGLAKQMEVKNTQDLVIKLGILAGSYFLVIKPILQKFGVVNTAADDANDKLSDQYATGKGSPFDPNYFKTVSKAIILTSASADALAETIYNAFSVWGDSEDTVYGVFRQLKTKTQVSYLSYVFFQKYKYDLYQYLTGRMSDSELKVVNGLVANML